MIPVRHAGRTHGYLWLLDEGRTDPDDLGDEALSAAVELAAEAGRLLAGRSAAETALDRCLRAGLAGAPAARERAARALGEGLGAAVAQVLVALAPAAVRCRPAGRCRGPARSPPSSTATGRGTDWWPSWSPCRTSGDLRPASALTAASLGSLPPGSTAGVSAVRRGVDDLSVQWREACAAARIAAAVPRYSPVAHWPELGAWRLVSELTGPDAAVLPLLAEPLLAETAEVFLDCAGSASRAAAALTSTARRCTTG